MIKATQEKMEVVIEINKIKLFYHKHINMKKVLLMSFRNAYV